MRKACFGKVVIVLLLMFLPASASTVEENNITITGAITNLKEVEKYITEKSYLQIIFLPPDGNVSGVFYEGQLIYDSKLPKMDIPANGAFTFKIKDLDPGKYFIVVQYLKRGVDPRLVSKKDNNIPGFEIAEERKTPIIIDLGELYIRAP